MLYLASCPGLPYNKLKMSFLQLFEKNVVHLKIIFTPNWTDPGEGPLKYRLIFFAKKKIVSYTLEKNIVSYSHIITPCISPTSCMYLLIQTIDNIDMIVYLGVTFMRGIHVPARRSLPSTSWTYPLHKCIAFHFSSCWQIHTLHSCVISERVVAWTVVHARRSCDWAVSAYGRGTPDVRRCACMGCGWRMATSCWSNHDESKSTRRDLLPLHCLGPWTSRRTLMSVLHSLLVHSTD
jgi:hypothetical protein